MSAATLAGIVVLIYDILEGLPGINATDLLGRGAAVWFNNVIVFSLWYWELDEAGPPSGRSARTCRRASRSRRTRPPSSSPRGGRRPIDYLYLAYTNATAFSPTDTLPVRMWAKMTMMLQSSASLVVAIARAINIL